MSGHKISADLFTYPHDGKYVVYAPFKKVAFLANDATVRLLRSIQEGTHRSAQDSKETDVLTFLHEKGIVDGKEDVPPFSTGIRNFQPTFVTLFITNCCNLRCIYCYASGGDFKPKTMSWGTAKDAIELVARNAKKAGLKEFGVGFHGGGEPTMAWALMKRCVEYAKSLAKSLDMQVRCPCATNAVLEPEQVEWIIENLVSLSISLDGTPDIQNLQRPLLDGGESYPKIESTLKALDKAGFDYGLRSTITEHNVDRMNEILDFFHHSFNTKQVQFEPLFVCGRCLTTRVKEPEQRVFVDRFMEALDLAEKHGIKLTYSGLRLDLLTNTFCGACSDNFCVTPKGDVTSCYEVLEKEDKRSALFFYGKYGPKSGRFEIREERRKRLLDLKVENIPYCSDCVAKWHCAGDCPSKVAYETEDLSERGVSRCWANKEITKEAIVRLLKKQDENILKVKETQHV